MQSQIDTLADRLERFEAELGRIRRRSELALSLTRSRLAAEIQALKDAESL